MTDRYAVIGNPIAQSRSPDIHQSFAASTGQDLTYERILAEPGGFAGAVDRFRAEGARGLNITTPFKLDAFSYATGCSDRARAAGAVNAMKFEGTAAWAENFDGVGVVIDIRDNLASPVAGARVLLLGAGGAARGALAPLLGEGPGELVLANRRAEASAELAATAPGDPRLRAVGYPELGRLGGFDLVLNATSASLQGQAPAVPSSAFAPGCLAYDMVYGRGLTPFLRLARDAGAGRLADGVGMLVEQAAEAFAWWRGVRPDTRAVIERLTVPLV